MNAPVTNPDITALLARWQDGDHSADAELLRAVYPVLHEIAQARLRRMPQDLTLRATELVHETYLRLSGTDAPQFAARGHFFAIAATSIRYFIVDHLRARDSERRGGGLLFVPLDQLGQDEPCGDEIDLRADWVSVHAALEALEKVDPDCARIVELKFFAGLTTDEIATASGFSRASVVRYWRFAKAWLADRLETFG
jgi:RNA polymerase sigma factor (TIGR02999 family)